MSLLASFKRVKDAVSSMVGSVQSHVLVRDGFMYASNLSFTIATPVNYPDEFLAPAKDFARALAVVGDETKVKVLKSKIVVSRDDAKADISLIDPAEFRYQPLEGEFKPVPGSLVPALARIARFMSDDKTKVWACAVRLTNGAAYATNNISAVRAEVPGWDDDLMLPDFLVRKIVEAEAAVTEYATGETWACFKFSDGTWARATLPAQVMPDVVKNLTDPVEQPEFALSDDWKRAYNEAVLMSEETLVIAPDRIKSGRGQALFEVLATSPVTEETVWHPKFLSKVVEVATHFDPAYWPKPAPFTGHDVRGVIIGRT